MTNIKNVIIIGSGPAGYSAAIYASRAGIQTKIFTGRSIGGQLTITTDVENYPGFPIIQGPMLMEEMRKQAENCGAEIIEDEITHVDFSKKESEYFVCFAGAKRFESTAVIIATGAEAKWLGVKGEEEFRGFGVSGCATCDGPFFRGKRVVVIGGGNAAVEEAIFLTNHASEVILIHRRDTLRAEKIMQERMFKNPKISYLWDSEVVEFLGDHEKKNLTHIKVFNNKANKTEDLKIDGAFVAIGHKPNSKIFENQLKMDIEGYLITKPNSTATNIDGIFAAGDIQDKIFRQAITAAGTGCMAALETSKFLEDV